MYHSALSPPSMYTSEEIMPKPTNDADAAITGRSIGYPPNLSSQQEPLRALFPGKPQEQRRKTLTWPMNCVW